MQEKNEFEKLYEMKNYYLVFLKKGPIRNQDPILTEKLQGQHIAHLTKMVQQEKMNIVGPLLDDTDILGICIYNVSSAAEAEMLANQDPAVIAGRLIAEVRTFYSAKGASLK